MQTAIVILIVVAALLFMARRMWRQWHGGNSCGCGNDECGCSEHDNGCENCPLQSKCNHCQQ
ncbi:MAG: hypothetical protein J5523_08640 [Muribaculaceae bacterium]|nr:hypothetical protein [Muribaculaceae bacterium]